MTAQLAEARACSGIALVFVQSEKGTVCPVRRGVQAAVREGGSFRLVRVPLAVDVTARGAVSRLGEGALPTVVVIGAMKAATSAVHEYLDAHPQIAMSAPKELNFFNGPAESPGGDPSHWWKTGQWHRGLDWYCRQFDPSVPARGESSPAYTSPSFPEVAGRMASVLPRVRMVYLVREPFARALSQYAHHRRDGSERRPTDVALLDPDSQYLSRSRYAERLRSFLEHFQREQLHIVVQERLLRQPREELRRILGHIGVDPTAVEELRLDRAVHRERPPRTPSALPDRFLQHVSDDVERLRDLMDDPLDEWSSA